MNRRRGGGELVGEIRRDDNDLGSRGGEPQTPAGGHTAATYDKHATTAQVEEERQPWIVHAAMVSGGATASDCQPFTLPGRPTALLLFFSLISKPPVVIRK